LKPYCRSFELFVSWQANAQLSVKTVNRFPKDNSVTRAGHQMTQAERDELKDKLDEFSKRLDAHVRDLKERGEFTDVHRTLIDDIKRRHDQILKQLALAEAHGTPRDVIKIEAERDFSSLFDDLLQINERLGSKPINCGAEARQS
jgi:hypothetical protein